METLAFGVGLVALSALALIASHDSRPPMPDDRGARPERWFPH